MVVSRSNAPPDVDLIAERAANARLIAAAPDLLAALKGLMAHPNSAKAWDAADQAVAKAEGRKS